ncbi:hypothetical protein HY345_04045 [Candidatus Microgenomates bacterium]|nr:hypothetical protein [Candidatus Microgenomates bacterium]
MNKANFLALCYADIFSYPLTFKEFTKWQIKCKANSKISLNFFKKEGKYYFLNGRKKNVLIRQERLRFSDSKKLIAQKISSSLRYIPWVKMIALTGALAMENGKKDDDIDLLIITAERRVWLTRFLTTLLLEIMGVRRRPGIQNWSNKICLNLFLDEQQLHFSPTERNLYLAHEILQTKCLFNKEHTFEKFLLANQWVKKDLPRAFPRRLISLKQSKSFINRLLSKPLDLVEKLFFLLQLTYMKPKITLEKIEERRIFFHPRATANLILTEYQKRLVRYFS